MKSKSLLLLLMLFCFSLSFASNVEVNKKIKKNELINITKDNFVNKKVIFGSCTINVYTELDNGTVIEGTVTITSEEMNWFKCQAIKFYGLFTSDY